MQIAAQMEMAPVKARECRGHHGDHFFPTPTGDGRWVYYWLSLPQVWFLRRRNAAEMEEYVRLNSPGCFVCNVQAALEEEALLGDRR